MNMLIKLVDGFLPNREDIRRRESSSVNFSVVFLNVDDVSDYHYDFLIDACVSSVGDHPWSLNWCFVVQEIPFLY